MEKDRQRIHSPVKAMPLKIALFGYGKMGKLVEQQALFAGHQILEIIKSDTDSSKICLDSIDICIDFSCPDAVLSNVMLAAKFKKNIVVGTTGWLENFTKVKEIVETSNIGFLYSPNFSLGVNLFFQILEKANTLIRPFKQYDIAGIETHHSKKIDSPSGTAKAIEEKINTALEEGNKPLKFSSVRVGNVPGTHTLIFDSMEDTITLTHSARNREGFASGAIIAANWLNQKKGMYTFSDVLNNIE